MVIKGTVWVQVDLEGFNANLFKKLLDEHLKILLTLFKEYPSVEEISNVVDREESEFILRFHKLFYEDFQIEPLSHESVLENMRIGISNKKLAEKSKKLQKILEK